MKALILNSGVGRRMGDATKNQPKCMTEITSSDTILSRQLKQLSQVGIKEIVITTGPFEDELIEYCQSLNLPITYNFVKNPTYDTTNYIYSIYLAKELIADDIVFLHGDLVFDYSVLKDLLNQKESSMVISSSIPLPEKDFKAVIKRGYIKKIGIEYFEDAVTAQPLYFLKENDWKIWLDQIIYFCENQQLNCYAENAFNEVSDICKIKPYDILNKLCLEVDTLEDLKRLKLLLRKEDNNIEKSIYEF